MVDLTYEHRARSVGRPRARSVATGVLCALLITPLAPTSGAAQALPAALGAGAGLFSGWVMTTGIFVAQARAGQYIYSADDLLTPRWELAPVPAAAIAGGYLGWTDTEALKRAGVGASLGLAAGAGIGALVGRAFGDTSEEAWAGAAIGGATGLLVGAVAGALAHDSGSSGVPLEATVLRLRIPVP